MLTVNTVNFFCAGTFLAPPCCGRCLPRPAALLRCPLQWPAPTPRWRAYRRRPRHALARRRAPRPAGWHDASRRASVCWGEDRTGVLVRPEQEQSRDCELELPARDKAPRDSFCPEAAGDDDGPVRQRRRVRLCFSFVLPVLGLSDDMAWTLVQYWY